MSTEIKLICTHAEKTQGGIIQTPQGFTARPAASGDGSLLKVAGHGVLLEGDKVDTTADHIPKVGDFVIPPSKQAVLKPAQSVLRVCGLLVVTHAGKIQVCCEASPERPLSAAESTGGDQLLKVNASPVLTGT